MNGRTSLTLLFLLTFPACSTQQAELETATHPEPDPDRPFHYAEGIARYVQTTLRTIEQDITGQTTRSQTSLRYHLTARIQQGEATRSVSFTIDSILDAEGPGYTLPSARNRVTGMTFRGTLTPDGRIMLFEAGSETSPLISRLTTQMTQFLPLIPETGPLPGTEWVDTTETTADDGSTRIQTTVIITSTAGNWRNDGSELPVSWLARYTFTGEGEQLGQSFTLEGSGVRSGEHVLSADGVYLGSVSSDSSDATVLLPAIGITVPVVQTGVDTVRIIR